MLEEYKDLLAGVAGLLAVGQMFSGLFICKSIYQAGSTKNFPNGPFVGGFVISILFLQHGLLLNDSAMGTVNFIGIAINVLYLGFFALWSEAAEWKSLVKSLSVGIAILAVLLGYVRIENPEVAPFRFGMIVSAFLFILVSAPLFSIRTIIREKNTDNIPFPMVVSGCSMGVAWLLYGIAAHQDFIVYQNLAMLILSIPQLILCLMYPRKVPAKAKSS